MSTYTYSIADDTSDGKFDDYSMKVQIEKSAIVTALKNVSAAGDVITITFKASLSAGDEVILDGLVDDHDGVPLAEFEPEEVKVQEEDKRYRTGGNFLAVGLEHTVPATATPGEETMSDFSFPFPIAMLDMEFVPKAEMIGDKFSICLAPDKVVGTIITSLSGGETVLDVSTSVVDNIKVGYTVSITDGVNTDQLGRCLAVDVENEQITVETAVTNAFDHTDPTYVRMTIPVVDKVGITGVAIITLGSSKIGGSYVPANTTIRFHYENYELSAKTFVGLLEMLY